MATITRNKVVHLIKPTKNKLTKVTYSHVCQHCEQHFISARTTAKYCSHNCKQNAYYERQKMYL